MREYVLADTSRKYRVDGFIPETKEIFEFYGCYYHGCPKCFPSNRNRVLKNVSEIPMDALYSKTKEREKYLIDKGFSVHTMWECELKRLRKSSETIDDFYTNHLRECGANCSPPLLPREAFFGGRVNANKLYHEVGENEEIHYYDFTSLYPYVCKYGRYPIGHPECITDKERLKSNDISNYEGLVYCVVLPPQKLYFPILPAKIIAKLMFTLCYTCAKTQNYFCNHSDKERFLIGVWTTPELKLAVKYGYKIIKIHEVWHFKETAEISETSGGLFGDIMNDLLKGKIEASGWPENCITEEDKDNYIKMYYEREKVKLDKNNIAFNPGKRFTYKIANNSFWGKFGQDSAKYNQTEFISTPEAFFNLLADNTSELHNVFIYNEYYMHAMYRKKHIFLEESNSSNVVIAAYVTAYARIKLWELLHALGKRCLYYDTDSVIFTAKKGEWKPELGDFLGELTNELNDSSKFITKFLSCGPKAYSMQIYSNKTKEFEYILKIKGVTINSENSKMVHFKILKRIIDNYVLESRIDKLPIPQKKFVTNKYNEIKTITMDKQFQLVYDKRMLYKDYTTLPFGYKRDY